ncbi:MAG: polysaccharide deacetylase family protein [Candidatus Omnitrophota bacterium]
MKTLLKIIFAVILFFGIFFWFYADQNYTVPILMYHSIDNAKTKSNNTVTPAHFYQQMQYIKNNDYKVISLQEYAQLLKANKRPARNLVVITLDDGYKNNLEAIRILRVFNFPATIFIVVNKINQPGYLSQDDIRTFLKNTKVQIGSHTLTHPDLSKISREKLTREIQGSKETLSRLFSCEITAIAYPGGAFDERTLNEVASVRYLCACATNRGFSKQLDRFALRRIKATNRDSHISLWAKLSGFYTLFKNVKKPY